MYREYTFSKWTFLGEGDRLPGLAIADLCGDVGGIGTG
jgi:hypothetical protein